MSLPPVTILNVDGNADSRAAVTATLQRAGFEVWEASRARAAFPLTAVPRI